MGLTRVAAAVVLRADGAVLLAQRPAGKPYAGYWEFPGGKLEAGESPRDALVRELREELGIAVRRASPWLVQEFAYPHAHVELHFFRVFAFDGEPVGHDGQAFAWQRVGAFDVAPLLPANTRVLAALALPDVLGITCAEDLGEDAFVARAGAALARGLRLVQLREKSWPRSRVDALARTLVPLSHAHGAKLVVNGTADDALRAGADGIHWTSAALAAAARRPEGMLVGASCHTRDELARAGALGVDYALVGPVLATGTHPAAVPLGWQGFARTIERTRVPVYALGGLGPADLENARDHGAHGIAMRSGAW
ncbi:8-oxo-dGTP diphosphatase [Burkholderiales bacterium]|nr:8-oxo-dGTP diphosphatase [Burkholderiales bacterium]